MKKHYIQVVGITLAILGASPANAFNFEIGEIRGAFDSTIAMGMGKRLNSPDCNLVMDGATGKGAPGGCLSPAAGTSDQGNLNYKKGDFFTTYLKGTHELLLKAPADWSFMARGTWIRDFAATDTSGITSVMSTSDLRDGLTKDARDDLSLMTRLLDLWVSKSFNVYDKRVRVRVGRQAINWGESLYFAGGINATNALDLQRLSTPGTQIKEVMLTAPMLSVAAGLGKGFNLELYYQQGWNKSYLPPVGSYWSTTSSLGVGNRQYGVSSEGAKDNGQWGVSLRWQPDNIPLNMGLYALTYHDKIPQLMVDQTMFTQNWVFPENRKLYGASINFPVGDLAIGSELSYRPNDAVSLSAVTGCMERAGQCWVDKPRYQWHLTSIYGMTPSNSRALLNLTKADSGNLLLEFAATHYSGLKSSYNGMPVAAGYLNWGLETDPTATPVSRGTATSSALAVDFSLTYDGSLIPGWQVIPEVYYSIGLSGRTPNITGMFMDDVKTMNLSLGFNSIPPGWQITANYARFMGGKSTLDNLLRDRDYLGFVVSRTF